MWVDLVRQRFFPLSQKGGIYDANGAFFELYTLKNVAEEQDWQIIFMKETNFDNLCSKTTWASNIVKINIM